MPTLDHVAIYVRDLDATREFYEQYLGATSNDGYLNPKTGLRTYFLSFDGGGRVEIMNRPGHDVEPAEGRTGWIHTAFKVGSQAAVDELAARLTEDGVPVINGPRTTGDGYYEAVILDPEGNEIEIVA
ncbi:glyoxalase [Kocuria soli]|uniref:Glyoxalase n=1 Tax=Kocuria soli TaxID=2485125 RepID=A0A3N3ZRT4_9MICC|nr:VOC family protein [Kocuria soli]ROZ64037.1 glyoxalase [Kocuria soli]